ncbi:DUF262 domain-containing protein [Caryophanon latum]|uniref:GmrSD restriction endonucleases N-terminal domain-containing protein n=1 Tax=Caryophanon latum TaxID=33977 RepID=A0A1C0YXS1_9BACL|nr:DUF262 domain-containing protein [Caryophanon latum]OCS91944.1 hypothetical protein A6K76_08160 [Caryophanon latum]
MDYTQVTFDIETLERKINRGSIKIDSDFQRGEVWGLERKKKLIDTILRKWPIPPIQLIETEGDRQEILDGLQRISTILSFLNNEFAIDGNILPESKEIQELDKMRFSDLKMKSEEQGDIFNKFYNRILGTNISIYFIQNATAEEIAELFYRFNNPMTLTTVEKRNAFFGETRSQIKELGDLFIKLGASKETIGFSNTRGTYEDLIVKVCYLYEFKDIKKKINSDMLINLYRDNHVFSKKTIEHVKEGMKILLNAIEFDSAENRRYSKSIIFSLLLFFTVFSDKKISYVQIQGLLSFVNNSNHYYKDSEIYNLFENKSMAASTDAQNIRIRQAILKIVFENDTMYMNDTKRVLEYAKEYNYIEDNWEGVK